MYQYESNKQKNCKDKNKMISHTHKFIFIHIPKCAGTSLESFFGHISGDYVRGGQDHRCIRMIEQPILNPKIFNSIENIKIAYYRMRYLFKKQINQNNKISVSRKQYQKYFKFTIVRNPWGRAYSWYKNVMRDEIHKKNLKINDNISLNEFIKMFKGKGMLRPQTFWLYNFSGFMPFDYIGRFENLKNDFEEICKRIDVQKNVLPHKIKGSDLDYRQYYDNESIDIVKKCVQRRNRNF